MSLLPDWPVHCAVSLYSTSLTKVDVFEAHFISFMCYDLASKDQAVRFSCVLQLLFYKDSS